MYQKTDENAQMGQATAAVQQMQPPVSGSANEAQVYDNQKYAILESGLKDIFGEGFDIGNEESQQLLLEHLRLNREQNEKLAVALEKDPRLSQMLADMVKGKRNAHSAVARYFGRNFMNVQEGTPEYEDMLIADEERRQELLNLANDRQLSEQNLEASRSVIEDFCRARGYEPAEFLELAWERLVYPILSGDYNAEVCSALEHAINYEKDIEDAFAAGDIKGRNTSIHRMRTDFGDGMPKGVSSVAPEITPKPRRRNTLIESALEA